MSEKINYPDPLDLNSARLNPHYSARTADACAYERMLIAYLTPKQYELYYKLSTAFEKYCLKQRMQTVALSFSQGTYQKAPFDPVLTEMISHLDEYFLSELKGDARDYYREIRYFIQKRHQWEQQYTEQYIADSLSD